MVPLTDSALIQETTFRVVSYNLLGAGHTEGPTKNKHGFPNSAVRMPRSLAKFRETGASLAGFQEFQGSQFHRFQAAMPGWEVYPGLQLDPHSVQNSLVWDSGVWELVEAHTIQIPYFHGHLFRNPYVLLENRSSGQRVWMGNFHNPANAHGPGGKYRARATAIEAHLASTLAATAPVLITGDMNDREKFICPFMANSPMHASNGAVMDGGCHVGNPLGIDWITGSHSITFTDHLTDRSTKAVLASDHPMVSATATLPPQLDPELCDEASAGGRTYTFCPEAKVRLLTP